ncbi:aquaporin [Cucurbitaria berberidis CBS 394.84]|uniref:Aquaporin n=1 Tax=Cucurbitaria berberidis CBS 394.84 TaxID=1168544 RepID=A0A9P4L7C6_9PLEO|nr:aquaporin [Cucurbitaria berberidis CBS 394.84]KAF1844805.1 aquaporin [Cucurbitaria berberidis CBS 394.84]
MQYPSPHRPSRNAPPKNRISTLQGHLIAATGEFVGTFMFLYFAFACQIMLTNQASEKSLVNGGPSSQQNVFTALVYGLSLLVNAWAFYRISGGLFNPAVTLGMVLAGSLPPVRGLFLFPAQLTAGMCAGIVVQAMFPGDISSVNTSLSPGTSIAQGVFIEMFMTAELVFVVLMLAAEKSKDTFIAPIGIGLALFVAMLGGVYYTGGSLNPARSFGPAVASTQFVGYHWIYWVGPFLGAAIAAGYYRFVKHFNYEQANPGQDDSGEE